MKKAFLIIAIAALLTSCERSCYKFNIKTVTTSKYNTETDVTAVTKCDITARIARRTCEGMNSVATTGTGNKKVTVTTSCTYSIQ